MKVPGSNLLAAALTVICPQEFQYFKYQGKTINTIGFDEHVFEPPVTLHGSVQAVSNAVYHERGLDFQRQYIEVWVEQDTNGFFRARSSDQIVYNDRRYQIIDENDWFPVDGWDAFLAVEVVNE